MLSRVLVVQAAATTAAASATGVQEMPVVQDGDRGTPWRPKRRRGAPS